jgi:release factor glutamine methyltransferase
VIRDHGSITPATSREDAVRIIAAALCSAGRDDAKIDARFLVQGILGIDVTSLRTYGHVAVGEHAAKLQDALDRRGAHEPVSRILGSQGFYGRNFIVTPDVLDPRPDTETLIDLTLHVVAERGWSDRALTFVDIGTGSGAIALTLLAELPNARAIATDISEAALAVAARNADQLRVANRVAFRHGRGLAGVTTGIDMIVSNPPYIPTTDIPNLDADVRSFDPLIALDGGADGLACYREIANEISNIGFSGPIVLEFGAGQSAGVVNCFATHGRVAGTSEFATDLGGHIRAVALEIQGLVSQTA